MTNHTTVAPPTVKTVDGADLYLQCMWEEAQGTGQPVDWQEFDRLYQDCLDVDLAQSEQTNWQG